MKVNVNIIKNVLVLVIGKSENLLSTIFTDLIDPVLSWLVENL